MNDILKFQTNIPELVTFKYNDFREGTGQYGAWYKYVVENRGVDKTIFAKEGLHNKLQSLAPLQGKQLEITLEEVDGRKRWKILLGGEEVAQGYQDTKSYSKPQEGAKMEATEGLDVPKLKAWAKKTEERVKKLEDAMEKLLGGEKKEETGELSRDGVHATEKELNEIPY